MGKLEEVNPKSASDDGGLRNLSYSKALAIMIFHSFLSFKVSKLLLNSGKPAENALSL